MQRQLVRLCAYYLTHAKKGREPLDPVSRFHLGNGARLERLNFAADTSERALRQSHGLMVNYLYDLEHIEQNHEAYAQQHAVVAASAITRLVKAPARDVVTVEE
jgi:malonyl-CoA decarboxylase